MNPLSEDLDHILAHTEGLWDSLRGRRLFITGGTGFFGCWLLESLVWANDRLALGAEAVVLTRDPERFRRKAPHLATHGSVALQAGDVRSFRFPAGNFSHVIHAAAESASAPDDPLEVLDTIVAGTGRVLDFAVACGAQRVLYVSSGAVYGRQPEALTHVPETHREAPDCVDPNSAYGEGKRVAELLCASYARQRGLEVQIARCFAFVGPYLRLDVHFAVGNFIRDCLEHRPIRVKGDGTPYRSYLYAADLMIWLWTFLMRGVPGRPYNVGSEEEIAIGDLARLTARTLGAECPVQFGASPVPGVAAERYVPSTRRARDELHLAQYVPLELALKKTFDWNRAVVGV
jgi:nucleoside-diphosphate-sugar epimerase